MILEFQEVHVGCRVEDGLPKGRLEARTTYIAMFQRRKAERGVEESIWLESLLGGRSYRNWCLLGWIAERGGLSDSGLGNYMESGASRSGAGVCGGKMAS